MKRKGDMEWWTHQILHMEVVVIESYHFRGVNWLNRIGFEFIHMSSDYNRFLKYWII